MLEDPDFVLKTDRKMPHIAYDRLYIGVDLNVYIKKVLKSLYQLSYLNNLYISILGW
jgi:hypothetical protein